MSVSSILRKRFIFFFTEFRLANQKIRLFLFLFFFFFFLLLTFSDKPPKLIYMAYGRTPLKRRATYGRGLNSTAEPSTAERTMTVDVELEERRRKDVT